MHMVTKMPVHGTDVSHHQDELDFARAKKTGLRWVYHKATEGTSFRDGEYGLRRAMAKEAGLPFGAYHFAHPEKGDAAAEAKFFLDYAKPKRGDLRPVLDLEVNTTKMNQTDLTRWVGEFVAVVEKTVGVKPIIYTPFNLKDNFGCALWQPRYNDSNTPPVPAKPWKQWDIWQFSNGVYGVPNSHPGLGYVDLNYMRPGFTVTDMKIATKRKRKPYRFNVAHFSLQFSDNAKQKEHDVNIIFKRGYEVITGTEAGEDELWNILKRHARLQKYRIYRHKSNWVAVLQSSITAGTWRTGNVFVADNDDVVGPGHDSTIAYATFVHPKLGTVTFAVGHQPTKGRKPGDPNYKWTLLYAQKVAELARVKGAGAKLFFYNGDQNVDDRVDDTFRGGPLTSAGDELKTWANTGHGPIDLTASYNFDGRVKAAWTKVLNDKILFLHSDHFGVETGWDVIPIKVSA